MKKVTGMFFAASVLCFWLIASFAIAAQQSSQQPSSGLLVPVAFSDIGPVSARANNLTHPNVAPLSGDVISISCDYFFSGCFEQKAFSNRVDIDGVLYYEEERYWLPPQNVKPNCQQENRTSAVFSPSKWTATPGSHTIKCILDSKNNMAEGTQNELNNTKAITITVPLPASEKIKDIKTKQPIPVPVPGVR
jgi:hypothetical protein